MIKFETVVLCLKLLTCLIVQRGFGNMLKILSGNLAFVISQ